MSRKNIRPEVKSNDTCIYCGDFVPPTSTTPAQNKPKFKIQSQNCAKNPLSARNRKRKMIVNNKPKPCPFRRRRAPKRKAKKQKKGPVPCGKGRCAEARLGQPDQVDDPVLTSLLGVKPRESELSPMLKGVIVGLRLGSGYNHELEKAAGRVPQIPCQKLQKTTPSCFFAELKKQTVAQNLAKQSDHGAPLPENPSLKAQATGIPAVIDRFSPSHEMLLSWSNHPEGPDKPIDMTDLHTQSESRALELAALSNSNRICAMEGAAPPQLLYMLGLTSTVKDDEDSDENMRTIM